MHVAIINIELASKILNDLKIQGFEIAKPQYTLFSAKKKGLSCTFYESGKFVIQGKETAQFIEFYLEPEILGTFTYKYTNLNLDKTGRIGIDEAGKGDFFGPLCIAGVYAEGEVIADLQKAGVKDSKNMTDKNIVRLAKEIRKRCDVEVIRINPLKYNELYSKFKNLNHLLAWGHATAIGSLSEKTGCRTVIIDQFAAESVVVSALKKKAIEVDLTQRHRGEEDIVVAAASIMARDAFLSGLASLEKKWEMPLPKGASRQVIQAGIKFLRRYGEKNLAEVGKCHFKTYQEVIRGDS